MRVSNYDARPYIAQRRDFSSHTGNFWGESHTPGAYVYRGYLAGRGARYSEGLDRADYIVGSYGTPIAWHVPGEGWFVPPISYSVSTARHQGVVRAAVYDSLAPKNLRRAWEVIPTSRVAQGVLESIRDGYGRDLGSHRRSTFELVVATGEAKWDGDSVVPADDSHVR